jgi:hypothetical protein
MLGYRATSRGGRLRRGVPQSHVGAEAVFQARA